MSIWGAEFISQVWGGFMKNLGILMSMKSSYIVERVNQEIGPFLCTFSADHQEDWAQFPKWEENAQNSFRYTSTNHTSFWDVLRYKPLSFGTPTPQTHQSWTGSSREVWELGTSTSTHRVLCPGNKGFSRQSPWRNTQLQTSRLGMVLCSSHTSH